MQRYGEGSDDEDDFDLDEDLMVNGFVCSTVIHIAQDSVHSI
jgi:hypothetical protein